jgi:hypothetical protein
MSFTHAWFAPHSLRSLPEYELDRADIMSVFWQGLLPNVFRRGSIMFRANTLVFASIVLLVEAAPVWTASDEPGESESLAAEERETTSKLIEADLPKWKLWSDGDREHELNLETKPVLRWTNPGIGRVYGDVYVWTRNGRPAAVVSFYKAWKPKYDFTAEMHSLSLSEISAERDGVVVWKPQQAGITLNPVPDATKPAESAPRRLQQMRDLASRFSARLVDRRVNLQGEQQELRLLTQPLYRYRSSDPEVLDGALFGIVLGTDPEVFLLLEARQSGDSRTWQYGLARMNIDPIAVSYMNKEVWRVDKATYPGPIDAPYRVTSQFRSAP